MSSLCNMRRGPAVFLCLCSALVTGCNLPRAQMANLREVHQSDGQISYRGNVMNSMEYALSSALSNSFIHIQGLDGLNPGENEIEDPCGIDLTSLLALARADSEDIYFSGLQIEAFGWLGPDDQYGLGRERSVIELGKAALRLKLDVPLTAPKQSATAEDLSPVLAGLARAGLGSLPEGFEGEQPSPLVTSPMDLETAIDAVRALELDRAGSLRALAVCDVLFYRSDPLRFGISEQAKALRQLSLELQRKITGLALGEALRDPLPVVRAAAFEVAAGLPGGPPSGLLQLAGTDSSVEVASRGLLLVAEYGLPLDRVPEGERAEAKRLWINFLVGQAQTPEGRLSYAACSALTRVVPEGPGSLRPEEWTAWWRLKFPNERLPMPIVAARPKG